MNRNEAFFTLGKYIKKLLFPALIIVIAVQLLVPGYQIINKYNVLKTGEEFKFRVDPVDPYDAFRGRYVSLNVQPDVYLSTNGRYGKITVDDDGFARISSISNNKPVSGSYVKSAGNWFVLPIDRYYMEEKLAPEAERLIWQRQEGKDAYIIARVKNGTLVISGLYIDGVAIEDIIRGGGA